MDHNNIEMNQGFLSLSTSLEQARNTFINKVKIFLYDNVVGKSRLVRPIRAGYGFALIYSQTQMQVLNQLVQPAFDCNVQDFVRIAHKYGFNIRNISKGNNQEKQKLIDINRDQELSGLDSKEQQDEFPNEEQIEKVEKQKEKRLNPGFVKPNIVLNRVHSQGNVGGGEITKEDASIEVKMREQEHGLPSEGRIGRLSSVGANLQQVCPLMLAERIQIEKQNYDKCSKMIDGAIFELLESHQAKQVGIRKEQLLNRVVEIYDMLSDGVENSQHAVRLACNREGMRPDDRKQE